MENNEIKGLKVAELRALAKEKGIEAPEKLKKAELIEALTKQDINADIREESTVRDISSSDKKIINSRVENKDSSENKEDRPEVEGILEIVDGGFGFLRFDNFLTSEKDIYVSPTQIRRFNLKTGDKILGISRKPNDGERFGALLFVKSLIFSTFIFIARYGMSTKPDVINSEVTIPDKYKNEVNTTTPKAV